MLNKLKVCFLYCLPVLIALGLLLNSYYNRVGKVGDIIYAVQQSAFNLVSLSPEDERKKAELDNDIGINKLFTYFRRTRQILASPGITEKPAILGSNKESNKESNKGQVVDISNQANLNAQSPEVQQGVIKKQLHKIWLFNSTVVFSFTLLPFLLMSMTLAFSEELPLTQQQRSAVAAKDFFMKFMLGCIIATCWIYILNPQGRGAGTMESYLDSVDLYRKETLPIYLQSLKIEPIVSGLLGWYLHSLSYIFAKITRHDVASSLVFSHLFKKCLLVYGIALILPPTNVISAEKVSLVVFLLGFFPLIAFSFIKEQAAKLTNSKIKGGDLSILPGISRWQILRLEEEGIDTMAELAAIDKKTIAATIPQIARIVGYWIDIARLYVIVGHDHYIVMNGRCVTASGFIKQSEKADFVAFITEENLGNCEEIVFGIKSTFLFYEESKKEV